MGTCGRIIIEFVLTCQSSLKKPRALLPRVFGSSALDFDVRWGRSGRQVCLNSPWTASWRVLLKLKALRPFQEVNCCSPEKKKKKKKKFLSITTLLKKKKKKKKKKS